MAKSDSRVTVVMNVYHADANGVLLANHQYEISSELADKFCTPHPETGVIAAKRVPLKDLKREKTEEPQYDTEQRNNVET